MPYLKNFGGFQQSAGGVFDQVFARGENVPVSGIYRCKTCGFEMIARIGTCLPNTEYCAHHGSQRDLINGEVTWHVVAAVMGCRC
jgi:hypothetical protein